MHPVFDKKKASIFRKWIWCDCTLSSEQFLVFSTYLIVLNLVFVHLYTNLCLLYLHGVFNNINLTIYLLFYLIFIKTPKNNWTFILSSFWTANTLLSFLNLGTLYSYFFLTKWATKRWAIKVNNVGDNRENNSAST